LVLPETNRRDPLRLAIRRFLVFGFSFFFRAKAGAGISASSPAADSTSCFVKKVSVAYAPAGSGGCEIGAGVRDPPPRFGAASAARGETVQVGEGRGKYHPLTKSQPARKRRMSPCAGEQVRYAW